MIITIDGPAASGKSSVGRLLAKKLGFFYLYSGLLYRGVASLLLKKGYTLEQLAYPHLEDLDEIGISGRLEYRYTADQKEHLLFDGQDITHGLKDPIIDTAASLVSAVPAVRELLTKLQQELVEKKDAIVEGRDAGTVVFPQADIKFYLTAPQAQRATRWQHMQNKRGIVISLDEAVRSLAERDQRDTQRAQAPLTIAQDARIIDNAHMSLEQTVQALLKMVHDQLKKGAF